MNKRNSAANKDGKDKARVVLVFPKPLGESGYSIEMPLSIMTVAAPIYADGYDVVLLDERLSDDFERELVDAAEGAICVGISTITGYQLKRSIQLSRLLKKRAPETTIIWGGYHPSLLPDQVIAEPYVDVVVRGQGEGPLREIVARLEDGLDLEGIAGVTYKDPQGNVVANPPRRMEKLDNFPAAPYQLLDIELFFQLNKGRRAIQYLSSQGCPYKCGYCVEPEIYGRWSGRSADRVVDEIASLNREYHIEHVSFADANFFANRKRVERICRLIIDQGLEFTWTITARADQVVKIDDQLTDLLRRAGCYKIEIGVESGSQPVLDYINKKTTLGEALRSNTILRDAGIQGVYAFMVGFPKAIPGSEDEIWRTLMLIKEMRRIHPDVITVTFYVTPYPGTPIYELAKELRLEMPESTLEWADWESTKISTEWINEEEKDLVDRCNSYYFPLAYPNKQVRKRMRQLKWMPLLYPLHYLARLRCRFDKYDYPLEWRLMKRIGRIKRFRRVGSQIDALRGF